MADKVLKVHVFNSDCKTCMATLRSFNDDEIRRRDLPKDVELLIHDLAYHTESRDAWVYAYRAQQILRSKSC